jgi:hypothetical protein
MIFFMVAAVREGFMVAAERRNTDRQDCKSNVWPGVNPSNINHELCHYADDVTRMAGRQPQQHQP